MILGIGVDIVHLPRIASLITRRGSKVLAKRILSSREHKEFETFTDERQQLVYLGSRWCIKEAVYKALYPIHKLEWKQVSVIKQAGKPDLDIVNGKLYGISKTHVSLSHDGDYAIAQVILESQ
ncbi:4'-phosphopantetheinyl transferase [Mucor mucedo]|uniref:4'-phosphopantetheinyl transferase domain-containing protein n=1 Tax=Mucor saturninus TaxID=64648 RepID=A0A8H7RJW3_9FUNG|nr:4'-phosphopantetheinyl transferase [Mucor mucedo]KAG2211900.1 hypothetical protein INT47_004587 [Mucor saturninus]KAI7891658.1 4'-phosphopantetheinyl transferase [Mucor mucedo]